MLEGYEHNLLVAVQDLLIQIAGNEDVSEIPTEQFKRLLAKKGFIATTAEIILAVDTSGFASSVDSDKIVPNNELPADIDTAVDVGPDVSAMAKSQAMKDINSEL